MSAAATTSIKQLRSLNFRAFGLALKRQPLSFLLTSAFIFLEYVRPAAAYPVLAVLPWSQITLIAATIACVLEGKTSFSNVRGWSLVALFTAVILASSAQAVYPSVSYDGLQLWGSWLLVMFIVSSAVDNEEKLMITIALFFLWNFKMSLHSVRSWAGAGFAFRNWGVAGAPGWFSNSGEFAIEMCVFFPMVVYFVAALWPNLDRVKRLGLAFVAATAVIGIVGSSSRGGLLGLAAVSLFIVLVSPKRLTGIGAMLAAAVLVFLFLPSESIARFRSSGTDGTSLNRLTYWSDGIRIANDHPLLGIGYNNWIPYYLFNYGGNGTLPHNIFIEAWAQLGYTGLIALLALIGYVFFENHRTRKITGPKGTQPNRFLYFTALGLDGALIGFMVSGFFVTVLFYPYFWFNLALVIALSNVAQRKTTRTMIRRRLVSTSHLSGLVHGHPGTAR